VRGVHPPILSYYLAAAAEVDLSVFDLAGRWVATLDRGSRSQGRYSFAVGSSLKAGVYFCRLRTGRTTVTRTVVQDH